MNTNMKNSEMQMTPLLTQFDWQDLAIPRRFLVNGLHEVLKFTLTGTALVSKMPLAMENLYAIKTYCKAFRASYKKNDVLISCTSFNEADFMPKSEFLKGLNIFSPETKPIDHLGYSYPYDFSWQEMRPSKAFELLATVLETDRMSSGEIKEFLTSYKLFIDGSAVVIKRSSENYISISDVYGAGYYMEWSSCMGGKPSEYFALYDELQNEGILEILEFESVAGRRLGRALLWKGSNPSDLYLDKVYCDRPNDIFNANVLASLKTYCEANGIKKTIHTYETNRILDLPYISKLFIPFDASEISFYPYMDSMRYLHVDGLRMRPNDTDYIILDSTSGKYSR